MKELLGPPKIGQIVEGRVIAKKSSSIFLDLGAIGTGIIYGREFLENKEKLKNLKIGDKIFAKIIDLENEDGYIELSVGGAARELTFEILKQKKEEKETIKVKILKANKGGLLTEISGIPAFLPVSQLSKEHYPKVERGDSSEILKELQKFVGKELEVKILDLSEKENQIILSEKLKELDKVKEFLKEYKKGEIVEGEITALTDFGAFLKFNKEGSDFKSIEGFIHISELNQNPETLKVGDRLRAKIIEISNGKVFLSLKEV
jgi:small subunit ribosomal protein S1